MGSAEGEPVNVELERSPAPQRQKLKRSNCASSFGHDDADGGVGSGRDPCTGDESTVCRKIRACNEITVTVRARDI